MKQGLTKAFVKFILLVILLCGTSLVQAQTGNIADTDEEITMLLMILNNFMTKRTQPNGVCLYSEPDYQGERICFTSSQALLDSNWDNQASSIGVSATYVAILFPDPNYVGSDVHLLQDIPNLAQLNIDNITSSLQVTLYDGDGDGIPYGVDQCLNTGAGHAVNAAGCSIYQIDTDNDGVNDGYDVCVNTIPGEQVDTHGCSPTQDSDGDGVANEIDPYPHQGVNQCFP